MGAGMSDMDTRGLERLPRWWPVIVAFVMVIAMFVRVQTGAEANDAQMAKRVTNAEAAINDMRVMVGEIRSSADSMRRSVERMEDGR
jgi:uncharacterized membrane protein